MLSDWKVSTWGDEVELLYGKGLRGYSSSHGKYRVYGSNGPIGWHDKAIFSGPGVILGRKGAYRGVEFSGGDFFVIDTAYSVHPKTDLDIRWLYYAVIFHRLGEIDDGSPIPSTTRAAVYVKELLVPPLPVQKGIAAILGSLDDKIDLNRRMNETLEAMARAVFKSWFVDFDPVHAKAAGKAPAHMDAQTAALFPDAFGDDGLPVGWREESLDHIADFLNGLALQKYPAGSDEPSLPVIKISELRSGPSAKTGRAALSVPKKYIITDGDVLFSWSGTLMTALWSYGAGALNQHLFKVTSDRYPKWFYYLWVNHHLPEFQRIAASKATTMGHIQRGHLAAAKVVIPNAPLLSAMSSILQPLIDKQIANSIENQTLAALRDLLLPKLMSGELRLRDAEAAVEAAL